MFSGFFLKNGRFPQQTQVFLLKMMILGRFEPQDTCSFVQWHQQSASYPPLVPE